MTEPVGTVTLRNFPEPVALHRVLGPTEAQTRSEARRRPGPPLVGREAEARAAHVGVGGGRGGRSGMVVSVTGEAGIGKSRLVEQLSGTAAATGAFGLVLVCSRLQGSSPLWPVAGALGRFFDISLAQAGGDEQPQRAIVQRLTALPDRQVPLEEALPLLASMLGIGEAPDLQPEDLRRRTFAVLVDLLCAMASGARLLLCVDDADAADPSTLELLRALIDRAPAGMLLVLTGRSGVPELGDADTAIELTGLAAADADYLVRTVAPSAADATVERLVARSSGVPFVLEEQARAIHEQPAMKLEETGELSMFLAARLDELGPQRRRLVGEIAVAGEEVRLETVSALSEVAGDDLDALVSDLCASRVLLRVRSPAGEAVRFRHALLCDAAYRSMLEARRSTLHARVADILGELTPAAAPEDVARHHELGQSFEQAARCWLAAARNSADTGALVEAIGQYRRSLSMLTRLPDGQERDTLELDVQFRLGNALSTRHGFTSHEAHDAFERAVELGERLDDSTGIFGPLWGAWSYWFVLGAHREATPLASRLLRIGSQPGLDPRYGWTAATIIGYQRLYLGDFAGAHDQLVVASQHVGLEPVADFPHDFAVISTVALAVVLLFLGRHEDSRRVAAEAAVLADALNPARATSAYTKSWVGCWLSWRCELDGDHETAIEHAVAASETAGRHGHATWLGAAILHTAISQCSLGRYDEGLPVLAGTLDAWRGAGQDTSGRQLHPVIMSSYFTGRLIEAQVATGATEGVLERIDELLAETGRSGERFWDGELHKLRARVEHLTPLAGRSGSIGAP